MSDQIPSYDPDPTTRVDAPDPPGVSGLTLFRLMPQFRRDPLATFARLAERHGDVVCFRGLWTSFLLIDPAHVEHVLVTNARNYRKSRIYGEVAAATGNGLFVSEGEVWLRQRRLAQPAFHRERIASLARIVTAAASRMLDGWRAAAARGEAIAVDAEMLRLTLGVVSLALFGRDLGDEADTLSRSFEVIRTHTARRMTAVLKTPRAVPSPANLRFWRAIAEADRLIYELVAERRRRGGGDDLLSMLMAARDEESGRGLSDRELRDQALTIIGAGYETTTQALAWTWYMLARHPAAEERLRSEATAVLGTREATATDLPRLEFARRAFLEAMRLYPPLWMMARAAKEEDEIGGYRVPAGAEVLLVPYITHRHASHWDDAERFDPDRFSPEREAARSRCAYFPFGAGPRVCIGNAFATMEAQLILATVAQRYRLVLADTRQVQPEPSVTLRPRGGLRMIPQPV